MIYSIPGIDTEQTTIHRMNSSMFSPKQISAKGGSNSTRKKIGHLNEPTVCKRLNSRFYRGRRVILYKNRREKARIQFNTNVRGRIINPNRKSNGINNEEPSKYKGKPSMCINSSIPRRHSSSNKIYDKPRPRATARIKESIIFEMINRTKSGLKV